MHVISGQLQIRPLMDFPSLPHKGVIHHRGASSPFTPVNACRVARVRENLILVQCMPMALTWDGQPLKSIFSKHRQVCELSRAGALRADNGSYVEHG
jgi:hypothetical protein